MKKASILLFISIFLFTSCDYFGSFRFVVNNRTEDSLYISYQPQMRSMEDILPTYEHGEDYDYTRLSETDTTIVIPPYQDAKFDYSVGLVSKDFPEEDDTPERWGIVPLWLRITSIVVGTDSIGKSYYAKDKWTRKGSEYTLNIVK